MGTDTVPRAIVLMDDPEGLRRRLEDGSLNLRGVAAVLERLEDSADHVDAPILRLMARLVDEEATTRGKAEAALLDVVTRESVERARALREILGPRPEEGA